MKTLIEEIIENAIADFSRYANEITDINESETAQLQAEKKELLEALEESNLQVEYLQSKFKETGSGNALISRNKSLIKKHIEEKEK